MNDLKLKVGTVTITGPARYHFNGYETASWWTDYGLDGGTYDLVLGLHGRTYAMVPATVIADHFVSRLFSASIVHNDDGVGKRRLVHFPVSPAPTPGVAIDLLPGWSIVERVRIPGVDGWTGRTEYRYHELVGPGDVGAYMVGSLLTGNRYTLNEKGLAEKAKLTELLGLGA